MGHKIVNLTLPEFAFLDANVCDRGELFDRDVILHIRSASIIEFFDRDDVVLNDNLLTYKFKYTNRLGAEEKK